MGKTYRNNVNGTYYFNKLQKLRKRELNRARKQGIKELSYADTSENANERIRGRIHGASF